MLGGKKEIFRKAALEKLASPERLDEMMQVVLPKGWLALVASGTMITLLVVWSVLGRIPERVSGNGVLIPGGSLRTIEAPISGLVTEILVEKGQLIDERTPILVVSQEAREEELMQLRKQVKDREERHAELTAQEEEEYNDFVKTKAANAREIEAGIRSLNIELGGAQSELARQIRLAKSGATASKLVDQARIAVESLKAQIDATKASLEAIGTTASISSSNLAKRSAREREIRDLKDKIEAEIVNVERSKNVLSVYSGKVTDILVKRGQSIQAPEPIIQLERIDEKLKGLVYVPARAGKRIEIGDVVHVSPSTVRKEESGAILGEIVSLSTQPATPTGMLQDLGNERLVEEFSAGGAPLRATVELQELEGGEAGTYNWTSGKNPGVGIVSGTPCQATVIVGRKRPIDYVIPIFRSLGFN